MKTIEIDMGDDDIYQIQQGMSFMQQNKLKSILESYIDIKEVKNLKLKETVVEDGVEKEVEKKITLEDVTKALKEGKKAFDMITDMSTFLLTNIVIEPKITVEMLNDPDYDSSSLQVLSTELMKSAFEALRKSQILKKTQMV